MNRSRLRLSGVIAGLTFGVGLLSLFSVPGGGNVTDQQISDFYASSGRPGAAFALSLVLAVGCWSMVWFFSELRARLEPGVAADLGVRLATMGSLAVLAGTGITLAPTGVQLMAGGSFVGVPIAQTLDQAGLFVAIFGGVYTLAVAVFLLCMQARRSGVLPGWASASGLVVAVLLVTSVVGMPAVLLPLWVIVAGLGSRRRSGSGAGRQEELQRDPVRVAEVQVPAER